MNTHKCIKCSAEYSDSDVDDYYCASCTVEKKRIAAEVDKKMASVPRKPVISDLQAYDLARGRNPFPNASQIL